MKKTPFIKDLEKQKIKLLQLWMFTFGITAIQIILPYLTKTMIDKELPERNLDIVICLIGFSLILILSGGFLKKKKIQVLAEISVEFQSDCRKRIFSRIQRLPYAKLKEVHFGTYHTNLIQDAENLSTYLFEKIAGAISDIAFFLFSFIVLAVVSPFLTCLLYLFLFVFTIGIYHLKKYMARFYHDMLLCREEMNDTVHETLSAQKIIAVNQISQHCLEKIKQRDHRLLIQTLKANIFGPVIQSSVELATTITYLILFAFYGKSGVSLGELFLFLTYLPQVWVKYSTMMDIFNHIVASKELIKRIDTEGDEEQAKLQKNPGEYQEFPDIRTVQFKDAVFAFEPERKLLNDFQMTFFNPGLYYLTGPSGIGKSTMFDLIMGFYELESGEILFNGKAMKEENAQSIRERIGLIPQEDSIFSGTVWDNITLGRQIEKGRLLQLSRELGLNAYIEQLPDGFETLLSGTGELSSGLKKTISILRACGGNPSLLLFDEVTSNLDSDTARMMERAAGILGKSHLCICITHKGDSGYGSQTMTLT